VGENDVSSGACSKDNGVWLKVHWVPCPRLMASAAMALSKSMGSRPPVSHLLWHVRKIVNRANTLSEGIEIIIDVARKCGPSSLSYVMDARRNSDGAWRKISWHQNGCRTHVDSLPYMWGWRVDVSLVDTMLRYEQGSWHQHAHVSLTLVLNVVKLPQVSV